MLTTIFIIFYNLLFLAGLIILFYKKKQSSSLANIIPIGLTLKLAAGISLGLIYTFYYDGGDTINYFKEGSKLSSLFFTSPLKYCRVILFGEFTGINLIYEEQPRALLFAKFVSLVNIITCNNYWLTSCYFSLFSFCCFYYLAETLTKLFPATKWSVITSLFLFPSVLIWTSGIIKESLAFPCMLILIAYSLQLQFKQYSALRIDYLKVLTAIISVWLIWQLKYYYFAALIPVLVSNVFATWLSQRFNNDKIFFQLGTWLAAYGSLIILATQIHPNLNIDNFLNMLLSNHEIIKNASDGQQLIVFKNLSPTPASLLLNLPKAIFSGLFRPTIWDIHNYIQIIPAIENLLLFIGAVVALVLFIKGKLYKKAPFIVYTYLFYIIFLASLMAFASPNFGSLARYKIGFLPFLVYFTFTPVSPKIFRLLFNRKPARILSPNTGQSMKKI